MYSTNVMIYGSWIAMLFGACWVSPGIFADESRDRLVSWAGIAVAAVSLILGYLRMDGFTDPVFQAVAHLWVGGLIASGVLAPKSDRMIAVYHAACLTILELGSFLQTRFPGR